MLGLLWIVLGLAFLLSLLSVRGEAARERYYREMLARQQNAPAPKAAVIVPVKGLEEGLRENLASLASLDYPDYELIVVARSQSDLPGWLVPPQARVILAGPGDPDTSEKINNLLAAVAQVKPGTELLAFADSDGQVAPGWLRALASALAEPDAGAATGYRWHLPQRPNFWSLLRSVWNAVIAGNMGPGQNQFAWGGAMAIRVESFHSLQVPAWWKGAISDDYRLSQAVRAAGLRIAFAPGALVASVDSTSGREFLAWSRRQMMITRFYAPRLWAVALTAHAIYCGAMVAGAWLAANGSFAAAGLLAFNLGAGWWKAARRLALARLAMPEWRTWFDRYSKLHLALVPAGTWAWLWSALSAGFGHTIHWRGYRLTLRRLPSP
ncbi:MAG: glycosyltransferase family 2 protein [Bryobacteraceae bacterium]|nr:glycosyltransferase family 2 protein [Bryobacteraceae bacterium]MDW8377644.1 glycosyltransferase family 2 protein [Bryobacterales bacterium]